MIYREDIKDIFKKFNSSSQGISKEQVEENRKTFGVNAMEEKNRKSIVRVFFEQFKDLLVIILIVAALISMITGNPESTAVIITVLILNAILGTVQYFKAEKSLESLKKLSAPMAKALRDGKTEEFPSEDLVAGDVILLEAGDVVAGDGRIIESFSLKVNESILTGEAVTVEKKEGVLEEDNLPLGDQTNMVFSGSLVTYGRAKVVVTAVGEKTQLGKITTLINDVEEKKTPLQLTMDNFSKKLSLGIMVICIIIFAISMYRGMGFTDALLFAVALAVAAIPEALSSIITISMAIGTSRMAEQHAIIKQLNAVEGLGSVSIICSDKTGTLTQNKMTVMDIFTLNEEDEPSLLVNSILCNDTKIIDEQLLGDPTETALVTYYKSKKDDYEKILSIYSRLDEVPFDSDRKLMSTLHYIDGKTVMFTKGALDELLQRCYGLSDEDREKIQEKNLDWSKKGLRVLSFAYKIIHNKETISFEDEKDLIFLGLMCEMDPPRDETIEAIRECKLAGIKPIMITGDHKITATAIGEKIGLVEEGDLSLTGSELATLSDEELDSKLEHIAVYARVSPEDKIRIVKAWQKKGYVVAMTGDGVNDGPALKNADVGVAMGITGTEVAKDAASMILTDDNFATIIKSVLNGRNIYRNIKNAIEFLLSGNMAGILVVLYTALLGLPTPLSAVHLLFINLITDSLPALAISMEPINPKLIEDKPRPKNQSILTGDTVIRIGLQGILIGIGTIIAFYLGLGEAGGYVGLHLTKVLHLEANTSIQVAMTMAFATLCLGRLWHGFNCRGRETIFKLGLFTNIYTIGAFLLGGLLLLGILKTTVLAGAFNIAYLTGKQLFAVVICSLVPTVIIQLIRTFKSK